MNNYLKKSTHGLDLEDLEGPTEWRTIIKRETFWTLYKSGWRSQYSDYRATQFLLIQRNMIHLKKKLWNNYSLCDLLPWRKVWLLFIHLLIVQRWKASFFGKLAVDGAFGSYSEASGGRLASLALTTPFRPKKLERKKKIGKILEKLEKKFQKNSKKFWKKKKKIAKIFFSNFRKFFP